MHVNFYGIFLKSRLCFVFSDYSKQTIRCLANMDYEKINFDLIVTLLEWIVAGNHQVSSPVKCIGICVLILTSSHSNFRRKHTHAKIRHLCD